MLGLGGIHPPAGEQKFDRHVIGNAPPQLDGAGIGEHADVDLGQGEFGMLLHDDDVGAEHHLEAAAAGDAVDRRDDRLVEISRVVEAAESARAPVLIGFLAAGGRLEVPARREESIARAGDDGDPQRSSSRKDGENVVQRGGWSRDRWHWPWADRS